MTKIFIDTNVWFSAFYRSTNSEKILKAHVDKKFMAVISQQVLTELIKNISLKIPEAIKPLQIFLQAAAPLIIKDPDKIQTNIHSLADDKDKIILQAAINSRTKLLTAGNLKNFSVAKINSKFNLQVLSPADVVKLFKL